MSDARVGEGVPPPVITVVQRGQITEVAHRGDVAVVADGGRLAASVGEPDRLISLRSSVKPFTAVAVLAAADEAGLTLDDEMIALASASLGLVAALAWNEAIKATLALLDLGDNLVGLYTYAIVATLIAIFVFVYLGKLASRIGGDAVIEREAEG